MYEEIVSNHQSYTKAVMDAQEWLDATHNAILLWGDTELERMSLHTNLERLKVRDLHYSSLTCFSFRNFLPFPLLLFSKNINCKICCVQLNSTIFYLQAKL